MELPLLPLLLVLLVAIAAGRIASHFGFPSVLGELIAGILLGPPVLGVLTGHPALDVIGQLGILLLMLYIGMEIDPAELKKASTGGFLAAIGGFITPFVACYLLVTYLGGTPMAGAFVGMAAGVTSLATKSRILADLRLLDTRIAHVMMAGALIADTLSLVVFAGLIGIAEMGTLAPSTAALALGKAIAYFVLAAVAGRTVIPWIGRRLDDTGRGLTFAVIVLIMLVYAEAAHLAGMHGILGAFLAGLFLRDQVLGRSLRIEVMDLVRDTSVRFLAPVFFVTAGFAVTLNAVTETPGMLFGVIAVASLGKVIGTALFYLPTGHGWREGVVLGASMNGRGAVEIIIAQIGLSMGLISAEIFSVLVLMAIATTAAVPVFLKLGAEWLQRRGELTRTDDDRTGTVIIGADATARALAQALGPDSVHLVDRNADHCAEAARAGLRATVGDALDERVLAEAGAAHARRLIALTGNSQVNALSARLARDTFHIPELLIPAGDEDHREQVSTARHLRSLTLFGAPFDQPSWDVRFASGSIAEEEHILHDGGEAAEIISRLGRVGDILPLYRISEEGVEPVHSGTRFAPGDRFVYARPADIAEPSGPLAGLLENAPVVDVGGAISTESFVHLIAGALTDRLTIPADRIADMVAERERLGSTVIDSGIAVPHVRLPGTDVLELVLARSAKGIMFSDSEPPVHAAFVLASSDDRRGDHLRSLAAIARVVATDSFLGDWMAAESPEAVRAVVQRCLRGASTHTHRS